MDFRKRRRPLYREADAAWFDQEWRAGTSAELVVAGMRERGYLDMTVDRCRSLAKARGTDRPYSPHQPRRTEVVTVEAVLSRRLLRDRRVPEDNRMTAEVTRYPVPEGGYRLCR